MKAVSDDLAALISAMPDVRSVTYKQDVEFIRQHAAYYIKTEDFEEGYARLRKKIRSILAKENPFSFSFKEEGAEEEPVVFDDLIEKYKSVNKKGVDDPYYLDSKKEMLMMVIKPRGESNDLAFTRKFITSLDKVIADYNAGNKRNASLKEYYSGLAPGATVTYGYTGGYKRNLDDSDTIKAALIPTSVLAFLGIFIYLIFVMKKLSQIIMIMVTLVISVVMTYAFCEAAIGQLNTITSILGAILMGFGIDFGIHFMYRLREEYTRTGNLILSIQETLLHSGSASATSAITIAASLYILVIADFKGFSDFGLMAGTGVLITALMMYTVLPTLYVVIDKFFPSFKNSLMMKTPAEKQEILHGNRYPHAKRILLISTVVTGVLAVFATQVSFDYDGRSIMTSDRPSIVLQEEINNRYAISSDPAGIYTDTLEETRALYDELLKIKENGDTIDSVVSIFSLVPDEEQQMANREIMDNILERIANLPVNLLSDDDKKLIEQGKEYLNAQPFTLADVPHYYIEQFRPVPESSKKGYLTFIYPKVSIWNGEALIKFSKDIGTVTADGKNYYSAGMAVVFADLAGIVLRDGKRFIVLAVFIIFAIVLIAFKKLKIAAFAMLPLIAGMICMIGLMTIFGWHINYMNIVIFPVVFGYGISGGVQLIHRYVESASVMTAVKKTGMAVIASSVTTLIGWGALLISNHRGLASMGVLACFGITASLFAALVVMPSLLQVVIDRREKEDI
jgi:predicted RND superfamily exporter protein